VPLPEAGPGAWLARDFDQLVDSPLELGPHRCASFAVAARAPPLGHLGGAGSSAWLERHCPTLIRDVQATAEACCRLMGVTVPASANYLFVLHLLDEGYGGLEHDDSCVLVYGRASLKTPAGYRKFLQLVAHEYLHQWNVRRLRPAELTPIDYHQAVVVPSLWFAEGITSYCDQFLPLTAGLGSEPELLEDLGQDLSRYLLTPGRQVQSLEASSQEAWVKLYRADAYAGDNQVSYYLKGAVIALVLDLHLRRQGSALSKVLRTLWQDFGRRGRGYQQGDLVAAFAAEAPDLDTLLPRWLQDHGDPDLAGYLADVGLQLVPQTAKTAWLGLATKAEPAGLVLQRVHRHGPAEAAGLAVGDELIAVAGERVRQPEALKAAWSPGQTLEVLFCRRGRVRLTGLTAAPAAVESWRLEPDPDAPAQALERRRQWLSLQPA
jgi:predicted metalloprotease with PDZ domain